MTTANVDSILIMDDEDDELSKVEPSNDELVEIQRLETLHLKTWDKLKCRHCKKVFSIITA